MYNVCFWFYYRLVEVVGIALVQELVVFVAVAVVAHVSPAATGISSSVVIADVVQVLVAWLSLLQTTKLGGVQCTLLHTIFLKTFAHWSMYCIAANCALKLCSKLIIIIVNCIIIVHIIIIIVIIMFYWFCHYHCIVAITVFIAYYF
jgi:hypothetical protein